MSQETIKEKLEGYRRKRYRNDIIRGALFFIIGFLTLSFISAFLESQFWFGSIVRGSLLIGVVLMSITVLVKYLLIPISELFKIRKGIDQASLAHEIGVSFPEVQDKLLNYLQLSEKNQKNELITAALDQKTESLQLINFKSAITLKQNIKYVYTLLSIIAVILMAAFVSPSIISEGPARIVQFNQEYSRPAPFDFKYDQSDYQVFVGDDFTFSFDLVGNVRPESAQLISEDFTFNLFRNKKDNYTNIFKNVKSDFNFHIEAVGFVSKNISVRAVPRPELLGLNLLFTYPNYTGFENKKVANTGSHIVPEGTKITWTINHQNTSKTIFINDIDSTIFNPLTSGSSQYSKTAIEPFAYSILLSNSFGNNKKPISYNIDVIKDVPPVVSAFFIPDTLLYQQLIINGEISDDYGFSQLTASIKNLKTGKYSIIPININKNRNSQTFLSVVELSSFLTNTHELEIRVSVADNDQINGPKTTHSQSFYFQKPDNKALEEVLDQKNNNAQTKLDDTKSQAKELSEQLEKLENKLKSKKELGWQEEKMISNVLKDREKIEKQLNELKKEHDELMKMRENLNPRSEEIKEKSKELQELIEELLDEETKQLYEELQKLLAEQADSEKVKEKVSQINKKEQNLEQELERTLELFKRMKLEAEIQKTADDLEKLSEKQKATSKNDNSENREDALKEQSDINKEFEEIKEKLEELNEMNQDLKNPEPISDFNEQAEEIEKRLDEISDELKSGSNKGTKEKQQNAGEKMQEMAQDMQQMQSGMEMEMMQENMQDLENIVDNLIKLSFEEERLIKEFQNIKQEDPRFLELSQDQLKLMKNAEVVKDSLIALANRVVQISNFITREVNEINDNLEDAMEELRERNENKATSHQQFAMTSMNNLALLLGDVLEQMQMAMSEAMGNPKPGSQQKPGLPDMSQIQEQLSKQIQELKKSGQSGRQLSEELAKLAAQQSMLREEMKQLQEQLEGQPENSGAAQSLKEIIKKMEENEIDLVNKRLTDNLINRQEDILTRMLEATESLREQKESPEREAQTAKENYNNLTPAFEEYLKAKEAEIELLKTIPLDLSPFYKKEVNDYFKRLSIDN